MMDCTRFLFRRRVIGLMLSFAAGLLAGSSRFAAADAPAPKDDFMPLVKLAPFVVQGQTLNLSIHARSSRDRRYAEGFAQDVLKVAVEAVTPETGKGLVIIGAKGEPHPIAVFRQFLALAKDGKLDPAVAARGAELDAMLHHWEKTVNEGKDADGDVDLEFDRIVQALPLPLEGVGAKLYQLAWREKFDPAKVEARLRALTPADLEGNLFARFDWVFYLPAKGAFDQVLDQIIADALKEEDTGFMARMAVKGVLLVVKPKIRRAIEALRQGLLLETVVAARTDFTKEECSAITHAYIEVFMPGEEKSAGSDHDRAVAAVKEQVAWNAKKARERAAAAKAADEPAAVTREP